MVGTRDAVDGRGRADRGASPLVGLVLLFGLVFLGAALVTLSGSMALDAVESENDWERARWTMGATDHYLSTVRNSDQSRSLPIDDVRNDGNVTIGWYNKSGGQNPFDDASCTVEINEMGSVVYELDDRTIAHQGGGIFERTDRGTSVYSAPPIGYDGESVQFDVVKLDGSELDGDDDPIAAIDHDRSQQLGGEIADAASCTDGPDVAIEIDSRYHEGWYDHLETAFDADADGNVTVTHEPDRERVRVVVENVRSQRAYFQLDDVDAPSIVANNEDFVVDATVENVGNVYGEDEVILTVGSETDSASVALDPGASTNERLTISTVRKAVDYQTGSKNDLDRYGEYEYSVETSDERIDGTFFLSYPDKSYYRFNDVSHSTDGANTTVTTDVTNIGESNESRDVEIDLEIDEGELDEKWISEKEIETEPWTNSTVELDINRSALPYGTYEYTVTADNPHDGCNNNPGTCEQSGAFVIEEGDESAGEPGEVIVTEPSDVSVSVIGTEISAEGYNHRRGYWEKYWGAVTSSAVVGDTRYRFVPDGTVEEIPYDQPRHTDPPSSMEDYNLNTFGTQEATYDIEESIEEGSVTIEATYWECDRYEYAGYDYAFDRTYAHYECADFGEPTTVNVAGGGGVDTDSGFVMTRDRERSGLPDIERGYDRQRNISEVFQDGTDDVEVVDGDLQLGSNDFAFVMETTMDRSGLIDVYEDHYDGEYDIYTDDQTELNLAAWDVARDYRDDHPDGEQGDPNFNDVIGFVQVDPGRTYTDIDDPRGEFRIDGETREPKMTKSGDSDEIDESGNVNVGIGVITIG